MVRPGAACDRTTASRPLATRFSTVVTRNPAACRRESPVPAEMPRTSGTRGHGAETTNVTVDPGESWLPAGADWRSTVPGFRGEVTRLTVVRRLKALSAERARR